MRYAINPCGLGLLYYRKCLITEAALPALVIDLPHRPGIGLIVFEHVRWKSELPLVRRDLLLEDERRLEGHAPLVEPKVIIPPEWPGLFVRTPLEDEFFKAGQMDNIGLGCYKDGLRDLFACHTRLRVYRTPRVNP